MMMMMMMMMMMPITDDSYLSQQGDISSLLHRTHGQLLPDKYCLHWTNISNISDENIHLQRIGITFQTQELIWIFVPCLIK